MEEMLLLGREEFQRLDKCSAAPVPRSVEKVLSLRRNGAISVDVIGHHGESLWEIEYAGESGGRAESLVAYLSREYACPVETVN